MTYITNAERFGYQRGWAAAEVEVGAELTLMVLTQKLGELEESLRKQVDGLSYDQLLSLVKKAVALQTKQDLADWLANHRGETKETEAEVLIQSLQLK